MLISAMPSIVINVKLSKVKGRVDYPMVCTAKFEIIKIKYYNGKRFF